MMSPSVGSTDTWEGIVISRELISIDSLKRLRLSYDLSIRTKKVLKSKTLKEEPKKRYSSGRL